MKEEHGNVILKRIKKRLRGLVACLMAAALMVGAMPGMNAFADEEPDNFYLLKWQSQDDGLLCRGKESIEGKTPLEKMSASETSEGYEWTNGYVSYGPSTGRLLKLAENSPLTEIGVIGKDDNSDAVTMEVPKGGAEFYFGGVLNSGAWMTVNLNGVEKGTSGKNYGSGGDSTKASFHIDEGKYKVQHTDTVNATNSTKWIIDITTAIDAIELSATTLDFIVGDEAKTLSVTTEGAEVEWTTSDKNVASVDSDGTVIPVGPGKATITATLKDDNTVTATCEVTVSSKSDDNQDHNHNFVYKEAKEATYTEAGYKAHYECTECHMWAEDANGNHVYTEEEMKELIIPPKTRPNENSSSSSSDSDSDSSGGGSRGKSGSISSKSIDVNGNTVQTQPDSGAPLSDRGGNWGNQEYDWTYTKSDGSLAKGEWLNLEYDGHTYWYYFDDSTIMQTNWFDYNGATYFLVPEMDGWRGRMATGWHMVDNKWYYFEPTIGANQGILLRGMTTPDGHTVGADGAWDGNGTTPVGAVHTGTTVTMN